MSFIITNFILQFTFRCLFKTFPSVYNSTCTNTYLVLAKYFLIISLICEIIIQLHFLLPPSPLIYPFLLFQMYDLVFSIYYYMHICS